LCKKISENLECTIIFVESPFASLIQLLNNGQIDFIASSMQKTKERESAAYFSEPYFYSVLYSVCQKKNRNPQPFSKNLHERSQGQVKFAAQSGSFGIEFLKKYCTPDSVVSIDDVSFGLHLLMQDKIQFLFLDQPQALLLQKKNPELCLDPVKEPALSSIIVKDADLRDIIVTAPHMTAPNVTDLSIPDIKERQSYCQDNGFCFLLRKNDAHNPDKDDEQNLLLQLLNRQITLLRQNGFLNFLEEKWIKNYPTEEKSNSFLKNFIHIAKIVASGLPLTLFLWIISLLIGLFLGLLCALVCYYRWKKKLWTGLLLWFLSFLRATPLMAQLSFVYLGVPALCGLHFSVETAGIITFSLNSAAYVCEIFHSALLSLHPDQFHACAVLHMKPFYFWVYIIIPQLFQSALPSLINESIALLKETTLISILGGEDVMRKAQLISAESFSFIQPLFAACLFYYGMIFCLEKIVSHFYRKENNFTKK
jgi:polar amino acid transport system permease protein